MMKWIRIAVLTAFVCTAPLASARPGDDRPMRLTFTNTKVSIVLQSISMLSGRNVVFSSKSDPEITLSVTAYGADQALQYATSTAGLIYRKVTQTYIVAPPTEMRQALEPFGVKQEMALKHLEAAEAAKVVDASFPYVTVRPSMTGVTLAGTAEDVSGAAAMLADAERVAATRVMEIVSVRYSQPDAIRGILAGMYKDVSMTVMGGGQPGAGGNIVMVGPSDRVAMAIETLSILDGSDAVSASQLSFEVYQIRYSSVAALTEFLKNALPDLTVLAGPEAYAPLNPTFRPLSGSTISGGNQAGGAGGISGAGFGGGAPQGAQMMQPGQGGQRAESQKSKQIVLRGPKATVQNALTLLARVDIAPVQVMVKVEVVDYSPSNESQIGFDWSWTRFGFYETPSGTGVDTGDSIDGPGSDFTLFQTRPPGLGAFSRVPWSFSSILSALVTSREAKILASPSVQVVDNEDANVFIGDTIRARIATTSGLGGQTIEIVEFPVGIILLLRPRVNADGDITMRVHPVVSTVTGLDRDGIPQTSSREAETTVRVKDGETMVIGGLIREEMSKIVREVPILSKLPIVGELFKSKSTSNRKSEILVFITPRIVRDESASAAPPSKG